MPGTHPLKGTESCYPKTVRFGLRIILSWWHMRMDRYRRSSLPPYLYKSWAQVSLCEGDMNVPHPVLCQDEASEPYHWRGATSPEKTLHTQTLLK